MALGLRSVFSAGPGLTPLTSPSLLGIGRCERNPENTEISSEPPSLAAARLLHLIVGRPAAADEYAAPLR